MIRVLYSSEDVRVAIRKLFSHPTRRRVAIVASVGIGAEAYLPSRKGLHLVCSPTPGVTDPDTIRRLIRTGVKVEFVDRLPMKVYWTEGKGSVVTSANLSKQVLGRSDSKEAGVELGPRAFDIDRILEGLRRREVTDAEMIWLDRRTARKAAEDGATRRYSSAKLYVMPGREWPAPSAKMPYCKQYP